MPATPRTDPPVEVGANRLRRSASGAERVPEALDAARAAERGKTAATLTGPTPTRHGSGAAVVESPEPRHDFPARPPEEARDSEETGQPSRAPWVRPLMFLVIAIVVVYGATVAMAHWRFSKTHVSTDNATVTSDVVQIAPQVSGTVRQILVSENQQVKKGQLLVVLDDATYRANVAQARANLDAAIASAKGAGLSVALTSETGAAQVTQAQGIVSQAESSISSATADVAKAAAGVATARATAKGAEASVGASQAAVNQAISSKSRLADAVNSARAQVETARAGVRAAQASAEAQQAVLERAARDAQRYQALLAQGAVSEQLADTATANARQSRAQLETASQGVAQAQATLTQRQADLNAAEQQYKSADAAIAQARAQLAAVREQAVAANAGINQAQAQQEASRQMVRQAEARHEQALGQLSQARTAPRQVEVSTSAQAQAQAKIEQARAALNAAQIQLDYTRITAPADGRVSKKTAEVGALVQPGTPLMALVQDNSLWVVANYKETQLAGVTAGRPAEIEVDGFPSHPFKGHVDSISAATGATFALLPPDNATGNFTKVVQRIPVKIVFDPNQPDLDKLRAGMSVTATIETN
jgi:membrane fusion protein (multidrug efflux system)